MLVDAFSWNRQFIDTFLRVKCAKNDEYKRTSLNGRYKCLKKAVSHSLEGTVKCAQVWVLYLPLIVDKSVQLGMALYGKARGLAADRRLDCQYKALELLDFAVSPISIPALTALIVARDLLGVIHPGLRFKKYDAEEHFEQKTKILYHRTLDSKLTGFDLLTLRWTNQISCKQQELFYTTLRTKYSLINRDQNRRAFMSEFVTQSNGLQTEANQNIITHLSAANDDFESLSTLFDRFLGEIEKTLT